MERVLASRWAPIFLSLLRIVAALIFMQHGTQKLFGFPSAPEAGLPASMTLPWIQGVIEVVGGGLLLIGLFTRPVAFILAGDMAYAYWVYHAKIGQADVAMANKIYPILNRGDLAVLFCFVFLFFAFSGAGPLSIDGGSKET